VSPPAMARRGRQSVTSAPNAPAEHTDIRRNRQRIYGVRLCVPNYNTLLPSLRSSTPDEVAILLVSVNPSSGSGALRYG